MTEPAHGTTQPCIQVTWVPGTLEAVLSPFHQATWNIDVHGALIVRGKYMRNSRDSKGVVITRVFAPGVWLTYDVVYAEDQLCQVCFPQKGKRRSRE